MIERAVVQFSFISLQMKKCGDNEPTIEPLKTVTQKKEPIKNHQISFFFL